MPLESRRPSTSRRSSQAINCAVADRQAPTGIQVEGTVTNQGKGTTMTRPRHIAIVVIAAAITLGAGNTAQASPRVGIGVAISPHVGIGVMIGTPTRPIVMAPPHREVVVRPHRRRFVHLGPPRPAPVIVAPPVMEPVIIPSTPPYGVDTVTVWVRNSNGSQTSVRLTRRGSCYFGPRGECYTSLPTNEQLRVVYGF